MTHEELLQKIKDEFYFTQGLGTVLHHNSCSSSPCHCGEIDRTHKRLRDTMLAVVELHKPFNLQEKWRESDLLLKQGLACYLCSTEIYIPYPCPTIQAIEKELE